MSDNTTEQVQDLFLPYIAIIPYRVQSDESIPDAAKIYFGQVTALCQKFGYCWATDEQLSKMKGSPIGTIKRWNAILEAAGYFTRVTKNVLVNQHKPGEKPQWVKKRRIYVNEAFANERNFKKEESLPDTELDEDSKKDCGSLKNETSYGSLKNETSYGSLKNETYNNKPLKQNSIKEQQQQEQVLPEAVVVVSLDEKEKRDLLEPFGFSSEVVTEFSQKYDLERLSLAVEAYQGYAESNAIASELGTLRRAIERGWKPNKLVLAPADQQKETERLILCENLAFAGKLVTKFHDTDLQCAISGNYLWLGSKGRQYQIDLTDQNAQNIINQYLKQKGKI